MLRAIVVCLAIALSACAGAGYRFERIDGEHAAMLPLKLDAFYGLRDGDIVNAEARFVDGGNRVTMKIHLFLRPPAEFTSGTYEAAIEGKASAGRVECSSLDFQGGQTALPTVGGLFVFKNEQDLSEYRVRIPATPLTRQTR